MVALLVENNAIVVGTQPVKDDRLSCILAIGDD
jgi:hypothetical protein